MGPMFRTKRASWQISSVFCREGTMSTGVHCPKINWILCRKKNEPLATGSRCMVNVWFLDQKYIQDTLSSATSYGKLDANIQIIFGTVCAPCHA